MKCWGILGGTKANPELVLCEGVPLLFTTRKKTLEWIEKDYGYIRKRPDLRNAGWKIPKPVRVTVEVG